ncbi:hypothetical protein N185_35565 [Sinorhizobium sp. GW3]|nr:hypothetical protein N185_35565 [Sinorhizobium sp. GW3]
METVFKFDAEVKLNLRNIPDSVFRTELHNRTEIMADLQSEIRAETREEVTPSDFETEDLLEELLRRKVSESDWTDRVYRLLAEGDCDGAMDIMHRELDLAPPVPSARDRRSHRRS